MTMQLKDQAASRFGDNVQFGAPFGMHTTMGVGGSAEFFFRPNDREELVAMACFARKAGIPTFYLGGGSNSICSDSDFAGAVIALRGVSKFSFKEGTSGAAREPSGLGARLIAQAGAPTARLVHKACGYGYAGIECLAGIPGTIGGAAYMNAGGNKGAIADRLVSLLVLDPKTGNIQRLWRDEIPYAYRSSGLGDRLVLEVELSLDIDTPEAVLDRTGQILGKKRETQPLRDNSAGCVFKNPAGAYAAQLIDQAGLKGTRRGGAYVSPQHANFICADKGTPATDVWHLIEDVRKWVAERHGVSLSLEVRKPWECAF